MKPDSPHREENESSDQGGTKKQKTKRYWNATRIVAVFGIIEVFSLVFWIISEDSSPDAAPWIRWIAICGFLAGSAYLAHKFTGGKYRKSIVRVIWFVCFSVCISLLFLRFPQTSEPTSISLDIGETVDSKDPFGTSFLINNQGKQIISNVWAVLYWNSASQSKTSIFVFAETNAIIRILPTQKVGLHFANPDQTSLKNVYPVFGARTFMNVQINFMPEFLSSETNQAFQFCVVKDDSGNFKWIPSGEGESFVNLGKRIERENNSSRPLLQ